MPWPAERGIEIEMAEPRCLGVQLRLVGRPLKPLVPQLLATVDAKLHELWKRRWRLCLPTRTAHAYRAPRSASPLRAIVSDLRGRPGPRFTGARTGSSSRTTYFWSQSATSSRRQSNRFAPGMRQTGGNLDGSFECWFLIVPGARSRIRARSSTVSSFSRDTTTSSPNR